MKKFILSMFVMGSFGFYVIWQGVGNPPYNLVAGTPVVTSNKNSNSIAVIPTTLVVKNPQPKSKSVPTPTPVTPPPKKTGIYNDGQYTGPIIDAYYGNVQVKAIITNGKLANVVFLDYPQDRGTSIRINSQAMPILIQEALIAQSANVNGVSGASATSPAFVESLTLALNQARV
jgi:uncharacterized protein with FMN-binding domain